MAKLGREFRERPLRADDLGGDPIAAFCAWLNEALECGCAEPTAMTLATADAGGRPSARTVLLKGIDTGFAFYTNYTSRKARELAENPQAALVWYWGDCGRQVRATGPVARLDPAESDAYFASRPVGSRLGAWASPQSQVVSRTGLERRLAEAEVRYAGGDVPRPPFWGGYRLTPDEVEFWQGRPDRLHDRLRFCRDGDGWRIERLAP